MLPVLFIDSVWIEHKYVLIFSCKLYELIRDDYTDREGLHTYIFVRRDFLGQLSPYF
ncbi:putative ribonucleotide-diphosphatereductase subunit alpha C-terminal protein [Bacillus phage BSTP3]|nr:putative ribonucleotide-diphosphatereductase subunit alpha C-terminal protein [Bacillus phage BSTP3]